MKQILILFAICLGYVGAARAATGCAGASASLGGWLSLRANFANTKSGGELQIVDASSSVRFQKELWTGERTFDSCSFEFPKYYDGSVERARGIVAFSLRLTNSDRSSSILLSYVGRKNADGSLSLFDIGDQVSEFSYQRTVTAVGPLIAYLNDDKHLVVYEVLADSSKANRAGFKTIDFRTNSITDGVESPINPCSGTVYMPPAYDFALDYGTAGALTIRAAYDNPNENPPFCDSEYSVNFDQNKVVVGYTRLH